MSFFCEKNKKIIEEKSNFIFVPIILNYIKKEENAKRPLLEKEVLSLIDMAIFHSIDKSQEKNYHHLNTLLFSKQEHSTELTALIENLFSDFTLQLELLNATPLFNNCDLIFFIERKEEEKYIIKDNLSYLIFEVKCKQISGETTKIIESVKKIENGREQKNLNAKQLEIVNRTLNFLKDSGIDYKSSFQYDVFKRFPKITSIIQHVEKNEIRLVEKHYEKNGWQLVRGRHEANSPSLLTSMLYYSFQSKTEFFATVIYCFINFLNKTIEGLRSTNDYFGTKLLIFNLSAITISFILMPQLYLLAVELMRPLFKYGRSTDILLLMPVCCFLILSTLIYTLRLNFIAMNISFKELKTPLFHLSFLSFSYMIVLTVFFRLLISFQLTPLTQVSTSNGGYKYLALNEKAKYYYINTTTELYHYLENKNINSSYQFAVKSSKFEKSKGHKVELEEARKQIIKSCFQRMNFKALSSDRFSCPGVGGESYVVSKKELFPKDYDHDGI